MNTVNYELMANILIADMDTTTDPEQDLARPLTVALYGTVTGSDHRRLFTQADMGRRPIVFYDPRNSWNGPDDPTHYVEEISHFNDDVRVSIIDSSAPGIESIREACHILERRMHRPYVIHIAESVDVTELADTIEFESNYWRSYLLELIEEVLCDPYRSYNLFVADSPGHAVELTRIILAQWQPTAQVR